MGDKLPASQQSKPFPGSLTPGWNDPPLLNNVTRPPGGTRLNLNKRVAFPLNSTSITVNSSANSIQPELSPLACISKPPNSLGKPMLNLQPNQGFHTQMTEKSIEDVNSVNKQQDKNY
ncbi:uncharacterized protein LOC105212822 [Zeugodacus cucurbitae]|uniref:Probable transaldolase n=1 Tax=Zeugodacus cucurbitae TaxID=28588 RepID=A0A0A1WVS6_ZEUCU|nr:uncharacterized protein LOC105212822 [Zeugodacus cucurbitae]